MSLADLKPGGLYIILFIRDDPPSRDNFHWGLYLHKSTDAGGTKFHIKRQGDGWIGDHGTTKGVFKSIFLVGLMQIADIEPGREDYVGQTIRNYDTQLNNTNITCRLWVWRLCDIFNKPYQGYTVLKCNDLLALEQEVRDWGNEQAPGAARNEQPRSLVVSQLCNLYQ